MDFNCLLSVMGAAWIKSTLVTNQLAQKILVYGNQFQDQFGNHRLRLIFLSITGVVGTCSFINQIMPQAYSLFRQAIVV